MPIYYFMFEAIPNPDNPERNELAGAFVNCWVKGDDVDVALKEARKYINNQGWNVINIEEQDIANRDWYENDVDKAEYLECFEQAVNVGIAAIINSWPNEENDEQTNPE
ncbi:hypothetical protein GE107_05440 [Cohnella sp. CFH 77786]|uniref:hypothetical protein n=1 Tax=Cohnella sp. CFH 77786 TaxID=2662265 RepID=UPI001C60B58B|nr:hypothetical protein [Cohnella sp. CFH 77786]MBW5445505.1 hypothetical protein [Cohnella sp. CFH 77786]